MPQADLERFFELRARYDDSITTGFKLVLLYEEFRQLEDQVRSSSVKAAIRRFIDEEEAAIRKELDEARAIEEKKRDAYAAARIAVLKQWAANNVDIGAARRVVQASAWWLTHSSGNAVRAARHAERLEDTSLGWSLEFGANSFLVSRAFQKSTPVLLEGFALARTGQTLNPPYFRQKVSAILPACVANHNFDVYDHYSPEGGRLVFGAQAIDLADAAVAIIEESGLSAFSCARRAAEPHASTKLLRRFSAIKRDGS